MDKILNESENYKLYSIDESVYLKNKRSLSPQEIQVFSSLDIFVDSIYGNPNTGLISGDEKYVVIGGESLVVYNIENKISNPVLNERISWIYGIFQDISEDQSWDYFRFVSYNQQNNLSIFRINCSDLSIIELPR